MFKHLLKKCSSVGLTFAMLITLSVPILVAPTVSYAADVTYDGVTYSGSNGMPGNLASSLWYRQPAMPPTTNKDDVDTWNRNVLPIGNAFLGSMVYGGVREEHIQFTDKSLFPGGPGVNGYTGGIVTGAAANNLSTIRNYLNSGDEASAKSRMNSLLGNGNGLSNGSNDFEALGNIYLNFALPSNITVSNYTRELDMARGVARIFYTYNGVNYTREYFVSYPDRVLGMRLTASQPGQLSFDVSTTSFQSNTSVSVSNNLLTFSGTLPSNSLQYEAQIKVLNDGGTITPGTNKITVSSADSITILMTESTNYKNVYPNYRDSQSAHTIVTNQMNSASAKTYTQLYNAHEADYTPLYNRVSFSFGQAAPSVPTDTLVSSYSSASKNDKRALEALAYQYTRYLLIASSRAGSLPANLQGVWTNRINSPWTGGYCINQNLQLNYASAEMTNLTETSTPLVDFVDSLRVQGRTVASEHYGVNTGGFIFGEYPSLWGNAAPGIYTGNSLDYTWAYSPGTAAYLTEFVYDKYRFTKDPTYLSNTIYPILKELSQFYQGWLKPDLTPGGNPAKLISYPGTSPEHDTSITAVSFDQSQIWEILNDTAEAADLLGVDAAFSNSVKTTRDSLLMPKIGSAGQLQEFKADGLDTNAYVTEHHLDSAQFAGRWIDPKKDLAIYNAAQVSLSNKTFNPWEIADWLDTMRASKAFRLNQASLGYQYINNYFAHDVYSNLMGNVGSNMQVDGPLSYAGTVTEAILQSYDDTIHLLPALPQDWPQGNVTGLRARGGYTVDVAWNNGSLTKSVIKPSQSGNSVVTSPSLTIANNILIKKASDGTTVGYTRDNYNTIHFSTTTSETYILTIDNLAVGKTATASAFNTGYDPSKAVDGLDGNVSTDKWASDIAVGDKWLAVDLDQTYSIDRWSVKHAGAMEGSQYNTKNFKLQASSDGSTWTDVDAVTNNPADSTGNFTNRSILPVKTRYVRLYITQGSSVDNTARIFEFNVYSSFLNDAAYGKTATASAFNAGYDPSKAVDGLNGNVSTDKWASDISGDKWLKVDLGQTYSIDSWSVQHAGIIEGSWYNTKNFKLQQSSDGNTWTDVDTVTNNPADSTGNYTLRTITPINTRYVRLYISQGSSVDNTARIYEFSVYSHQKIDDGDQQVTYSGTWTYDQNWSGAYLNTLHYTANNNDYVQYTFYGTGIDLYSLKGPNKGNVDVYIDGILDTTFSCYNSLDIPSSVVYQKRGLTLASHTIKFVKTSSTYFTVDALDIV